MVAANLGDEGAEDGGVLTLSPAGAGVEGVLNGFGEGGAERAAVLVLVARVVPGGQVTGRDRDGPPLSVCPRSILLR